MREAAQLIAGKKHNRLPVIEHGRLVGVVTRVDVLDGAGRRRGLSVLRALARVDPGAIERNCARLAAAVAPARLCAVVKADGYGHGAVPAARAAQARRGALARGGDGRRGGRAARRRASTGRCS